jgi:hypothetical protein
MTRLRVSLARIAGLFTGHRGDADAEFRAHLDMEIAESIRRGMSPEAARRQAMLATGGLAAAIFSVVRGVLLKPLPHRDGDRLLHLLHSADGIGGGDVNFAVPDARDFRSTLGNRGPHQGRTHGVIAAPSISFRVKYVISSADVWADSLRLAPAPWPPSTTS